MQPAYFTAGAVGAAEIAAIRDQAAAQRRRYQEVEKAAVLLPGAELHLTDRRGRRIILDEHGYAENAADQFVDLDECPRRIVARLVRQMRSGDVVRQCHSVPDQAVTRDPRRRKQVPD